MKRLLIFAISLPFILHSVPAQAATVTATGSDPSVCNQTVGNSTGVTAVRISGGDCVVEFKNAAAATTWTVPTGLSSVWVLVVAGGGGGGGDEGGGGGGGGYIEDLSFAVTGGSSISISVGDGGIAGTNDSAPGGNGGDSVFSTLTAKGGGGGGTAANSVVDSRNGRSGGSGGGGAGEGNTTTGGSASPAGQGFAGGGGKRPLGFGGGGALEAGETDGAGYGGDGKTSSITGDSVTRAGGGGGGGGNSTSQSNSNGGAGGGGRGGGSGSGQVGAVGTDFLGGGGGGANGPSEGYSGGSGIVIIRYTPDTTAPTFTSSSSFSAAENIATSATAATIRVSESATVTISSGADRTLFDITRSETNTALITFKTSPNFEAPADSGGNNVYDLTLSATDATGNAGTQAITISVTNVVEIPVNTSAPTISGTTTFGQVLTAGNGSWSESPSAYTYQWSRSATSGGAYTSIPSATSSTYTLVTADVGQYLKLRVLAANSAGSTPETSTATAQIARANQTITFSSLGTSSKTYPYSQALSMSTSGSSGAGAITYAIVAGGSATSCALSNSSASATITASTSGTCLVAATIAADTNYNSATSSNLTFTFSKASQSALSISSTSGSFGTPLTLATNGGSGDGLVTYVYAEGTTTCTLSSGVLTAAATGTCLVTATKATDDNYSAISSSQTTITFAAGSTTATITIADGSLVFRQAKLLTASASVVGKVTFRVNNKILPGCKNKSTTGSAPNIIATCSYRPSTRGSVTISVTLNPADLSYIGTVKNSDTYFVNNRSGARGR